MKSLFNKNFFTEVEYKPDAIIPKTIYLNGAKLSEQKLSALKHQWQVFNPGFTIVLIDIPYLEKFIPPELKSLNPKLVSFMARFYLLNKNGGVYVDANFKPAKLDEFHHILL